MHSGPPGIPDCLLFSYDPDSVEVDEALHILISFSLVENRNQRYEIHRLIQFAAMNWLTQRRKLEYWQERALTTMSGCLPDYDPKHQELYATCLPHMNEVLRNKLQIPRTTLIHRASLFV